LNNLFRSSVFSRIFDILLLLLIKPHFTIFKKIM